MTWSPISNTVPQYQASDGSLASGYYLKFYNDGTTTPINMATDSTGGTLLAKCQLNASGYPINGSSAVFIPHIDQTYKLALYTNATDADADTTANAVWIVDALQTPQTAGDLQSTALDDGTKGFHLVYYPLTSAEQAAGVTPTNYEYAPGVPERYGAAADGTTDDSAAFLTAITASSGDAIPLTRGKTYRIDTLANTAITESIHIIGNGAIIDGGSTTTSGFIIDGTINQTIAHVIFDGVVFQNIENHAFQCNNGYVVLNGSNSATITRLVVNNCTIKDGMSGFWARCIVGECIFTNNHINNLASSTTQVVGIHAGQGGFNHSSPSLINGMKDFIITGNVIDDLDCTLASSPECHAIICYGRNVVIQGNIIKSIQNSSAANGAEGIYIDTRQATITGNVLIDAGTQEASINIKGWNRTQDDTLDNGAPGYGVIVSGNQLYSTTGAYHGVFIQTEDVLIEGNYFEGFGGYAVYNTAPSDVAATAAKYYNLKISNNIVRDHRGVYAIFIQNASGNCSVSGNQIHSLLASQGVIADVYGIYLKSGDTASDDDMGAVTINNNTIYSDTVTSASSSCRGIVVNIQTGVSCANLEIKNNNIHISETSATEHGITLFGAGTITGLFINGNNCLNVDSTPFSLSTLTITKQDYTNNQFRPKYLTYALNGNSYNLEQYHTGCITTNKAAGATWTFVLPAAVPGLEFSFARVAAQSLRADPDGTEVIRGGGAGKYVSLDSDPASITLFCETTGTWEVLSSTGTLSYEA